MKKNNNYTDIYDYTYDYSYNNNYSSCYNWYNMHYCKFITLLYSSVGLYSFHLSNLAFLFSNFCTCCNINYTLGKQQVNLAEHLAVTSTNAIDATFHVYVKFVVVISWFVGAKFSMTHCIIMSGVYLWTYFWLSKKFIAQFNFAQSMHFVKSIILQGSVVTLLWCWDLWWQFYCTFSAEFTSHRFFKIAQYVTKIWTRFRYCLFDFLWHVQFYSLLMIRVSFCRRQLSKPTIPQIDVIYSSSRLVYSHLPIHLVLDKV